MCLACQMEDELWFAYLDQVARQEKTLAADAAEPAKVVTAPETETNPNPNSKPAPETKPAPSSPFACEELPSE